jgi:hypothetical protein
MASARNDFSRRLAFFLVVTALTSCGNSGKPAEAASNANKQSMKEVTELICDVDKHAGISAETDPIEAESNRYDFLSEHITNPDGIYFYTLLRAKDPQAGAKMLAEQAKDMKLKKCDRAAALEAAAKE